MSDKRDFFISYTKNDEQQAKWIAGCLEANGYTTFIQAWDFKPGQNFVVQMQEAIRHSEKTIAVLSNDYINSAFCSAEWAAIFTQDPIGTNSFLIPVRIAAVNPPGLLAAIIYIDLVGLDEQEAEKALLDGIDSNSSIRNQPDFPAQDSAEENDKKDSEDADEFSKQFKDFINKGKGKLHHRIAAIAVILGIIASIITVIAVFQKDKLANAITNVISGNNNIIVNGSNNTFNEFDSEFFEKQNDDISELLGLMGDSLSNIERSGAIQSNIIEMKPAEKLIVETVVLTQTYKNENLGFMFSYPEGWDFNILNVEKGTIILQTKGANILILPEGVESFSISNNWMTSYKDEGTTNYLLGENKLSCTRFSMFSQDDKEMASHFVLTTPSNDSFHFFSITTKLENMEANDDIYLGIISSYTRIPITKAGHHFPCTFIYESGDTYVHMEGLPENFGPNFFFKNRIDMGFIVFNETKEDTENESNPDYILLVRGLAYEESDLYEKFLISSKNSKEILKRWAIINDEKMNVHIYSYDDDEEQMKVYSFFYQNEALEKNLLLLLLTPLNTNLDNTIISDFVSWGLSVLYLNLDKLPV